MYASFALSLTQAMWVNYLVAIVSWGKNQMLVADDAA